MNVLSLFDGISCGQVALNRIGAKYGNYFASEIDQNAIKITQHNYPNTIQLGDVREWEKWKLPKIDLLLAGSPCFVGSTPVVCDDDIKPICDIKVGDRVLTHNGRYKKVLKVGASKKEIYEINSQGSYRTETTENHPYYVRKRSKKFNSKTRRYEWVFSEPYWEKVKNISKSYYVGTPILTSSLNPLNLTEDECFLLGIYLGDGHTRKDFKNKEKTRRHWQLIISIGEHEVNDFEKAVKIKHSIFKHTKSVCRAVFSNKRMVEIAETHCGCGAGNKGLSKMILDLPTNLLKRFLDGYEFSDGSTRKNEYRIASISPKIPQTLPIAIAKVYQTTCSVQYNKRKPTCIIEGRLVNQKNSWEVSYRKYHTKQSRAWVIDGIVWNPVKSITKTNKTDFVYNIEVDDDKSYIANTHIVHNCTGFSCAGKRLAFKDEQSALIQQFFDILDNLKPNYFLLENVKMKQEYQDIISERVGVEPIMINSSLVSAQNRPRLYWTNIPNVDTPKDKGLLIKDILEETDEKNYEFVHPNWRESKIQEFGKNYLQYDMSGKGYKSQSFRAYYLKSKMCCLNHTSPHGPKILLKDEKIRKATRLEHERLQTLPDGYTNIIEMNKAKRAIGNGWTVDVICHILSKIH